MVKFGEWLQIEIARRGWTQAELARRAHLGDATLSRIITGTRQAGPDVALSIARALGEPPEKVFRLAGLLPPLPAPGRAQEFQEIAELLASIPNGPIRAEAMAAIRAIAESAHRRALEAGHRET